VSSIAATQKMQKMGGGKKNEEKKMKKKKKKKKGYLVREGPFKQRNYNRWRKMKRKTF
jgi:hypothetical protein